MAANIRGVSVIQGQQKPTNEHAGAVVFLSCCCEDFGKFQTKATPCEKSSNQHSWRDVPLTTPSVLLDIPVSSEGKPTLPCVLCDLLLHLHGQTPELRRNRSKPDAKVSQHLVVRPGIWLRRLLTCAIKTSSTIAKLLLVTPHFRHAHHLQLPCWRAGVQQHTVVVEASGGRVGWGGRVDIAHEAPGKQELRAGSFKRWTVFAASRCS